MLLSLHLAVAWDAQQWWARGLLLAHFGLFLLWQPVWRGGGRIPPGQAMLVLGIGALFALAGNGWLIAAWIAVLFALIGGGVPSTVSRGARIAAIVAAAYLITLLLARVLPQLVSDPLIANQIAPYARFGLALLPLIVLAMPATERLPGSPVIIDLFYTLTLFLLALVLALGSLVILQQQAILGEQAYLFGVIQVLMAVAALLLGVSWLWNPRAGFSGIGILLSRTLLGLGLPFEQRMRRLATLAEGEPRADQFLHAALTDLLDLPWANGYAWTSTGSRGEVGRLQGSVETFESGRLQLKLHASRSLTPAILLHQTLLFQMIAHFHAALGREQQLRQTAYMRAIYETGARLTHDVKNLLQSLSSLCAAAEMRGSDEAGFRALVQRQLPQITRRLGATLEKLRSPKPLGAVNEIDALTWWRDFQVRYVGRPVQFRAVQALPEQRVPAELFDSVGDTLIENALYKAARDGGVRTVVELLPGPALRVTDDGEPVPRDLLPGLMRETVASHSGLGVGLCQAAAFATGCGYRLWLAGNRAGWVCFELQPLPSQG